MRFYTLSDIDQNVVLDYVEEAIGNQKLGKELLPERKGEIVVVSTILNLAFKNEPSLKENFSLLTLGKQREYAEYIETAKRDANKERRLKKIKSMILKGIGLHDKCKTS